MTKLEDLRSEEWKAIEELRMRMKSLIPPDMCEDDLLFYRFLKARNFDIEKAELMLRKHITFRKTRRVDTILRDFKPKEVFTKYVQATNLGEDKEGHPMLYIAAGKLDIRDMAKCFKFNNYFDHWLWFMEVQLARLRAQNVKTNRNVWKFVLIIDLDRLDLANTMHPLSASYSLRLIEAYQNNCPELLQSAFIINAPKYFVLLFSILQRVLALEVAQKIHVFAQSGWKQELLKCIDADVLPAFLGGNRTDPNGNPMCYTFVCHGGRIPPKYFLSENDKTFKNESEVKHIIVHPRTSHEIFIKIGECGSVIRWEFDVKSKNIDFGVYFKESEELKELLPMYRYDASKYIENDSYKCQWPGTYVIVFDNTYSWFSSKKVSYCITVLNPVD